MNPRFFFVAIAACFAVGNSVKANERPNILWFVVDDMSPKFSCYGEKLIETPAVDKLAAEGTRFSRAYVTAPVCSPCRSALITGMYATSIGAHHHRSGRGPLKIELPADVTPAPALFQAAGYYTCIGSGLTNQDQRTERPNKKAAKNKQAQLGKTDYNFEWDPAIYDSDDWASRGEGQPFFMQVQTAGGKLREGKPEARAAFQARVIQELGTATDPERVVLPPYYPRDPALLEDWALFLDSVRMTDLHVGRVIERLEKEQLLENTLIIFMTDHGISHARGKQFLYDEGTHIPFVVRGPGIAKNSVRSDLIEHIDMAAISFAAAGIPLPPSLQGRDIFAADYKVRDAVFAARDRCDETVERIRSVRTDRFLYIRNFFPQRPHLQPNAYKDGKAIVQTLRDLHAKAALPKLTESLLFSPTRPQEELYEYGTDPYQVTNLATNPEFEADLKSHRERLDQWMISTQDKGFESEAMYDSDMEAYLKSSGAEVKANVAQMKNWAAEGK